MIKQLQICHFPDSSCHCEIKWAGLFHIIAQFKPDMCCRSQGECKGKYKKPSSQLQTQKYLIFFN